MSKAGLDMLTKTTALELAPYGVRVNSVAPCMIEDSNMYKVTGYSQQEFERLKERAKNNIPLQRLCCDEDAAKAIIFLSSDKACHINGHIMKVDGAKSLTSRGQQIWYGYKFMSRKFEQEPQMFTDNKNALIHSTSYAAKPQPQRGDID